MVDVVKNVEGEKDCLDHIKLHLQGEYLKREHLKEEEFVDEFELLVLFDILFEVC